MTQWTTDMIHKGMEVYSSENEDLGHVEEVYEDSFLVQKGLIFHKDRYIPYETIASINDEHIALMISKAEAKEMHWEVRPSKLESDPTQIFYDRGHESPNPLNTPHI